MVIHGYSGAMQRKRKKAIAFNVDTKETHKIDNIAIWSHEQGFVPERVRQACYHNRVYRGYRFSYVKKNRLLS